MGIKNAAFYANFKFVDVTFKNALREAKNQKKINKKLKIRIVFRLRASASSSTNFKSA
jgi:hypothetical protein